MKDIKLKATFSDSGKVIEFSISDLIMKMGSQGAGDYSLEEQVGEDFAYLSENFENAILEVVKCDYILTAEQGHRILKCLQCGDVKPI